jgi:ribosomal-protein-alanine N-acetyltransferase
MFITNPMSFPEIETERLLLKPMNESFISEEYLSWMNDPEVYLYLDTGGDYSMNELQEYIKQSIKKKILFWAITVKDSGKHIGNIKIDPISQRHGTGEYGILLGDRAEWGKGYASEATDALLKYCFHTLRIRKINLGVVKDNVSAVRLYKKLGFKTEGEFEAHGFYNGKYCNTLRMALFAPAYTDEK